jgi:hypothetical protein
MDSTRSLRFCNLDEVPVCRIPGLYSQLIEVAENKEIVRLHSPGLSLEGNRNIPKNTGVQRDEAKENPSVLLWSDYKAWRTTMDNGKQKLKLEENIAAVRFTEFAMGDAVTGVAEIIPAGEIVHLDRQAPVVGHMREIEWKGFRYGVFPEDLLKRADKHPGNRG